MTPIRRLRAASRGEPVDRAPWFVHVPEASYEELLEVAREHSPDAVITASADATSMLHDELGDQRPAILFEIRNPVGAAALDEVDLNLALAIDPSQGDVVLAKYESECRDSIEWANDSKCDGIYYRIFGASEDQSTPMQYGGHYLEVDRRLLAKVSGEKLVVAHVEGSEGLYFDAISDLSLDFLMWNDAVPNASPADVIESTSSAVACGLLSDPAQLWSDLGGRRVALAARVPSFADPIVEAGRELSSKLRSLAAHG